MTIVLPPDCAEAYEPVRLLGRGGCGAVVLARQVNLGRLAAVKVLDVALSPDDVQRARFLREARITAQLAHPHVVEILDHGAKTAVPWIAYEYLEGGSLRDQIERGPLPLAAAAEVVRQVAAALTAAHAKGILHRDVKPENVLVAGPGVYKLADFGLAHWSSSSSIATATGVVLGTPAYLAPELLSDTEPTTAVDIYALTALLFALATGRDPFVADSLHALLSMHLDTPPPSLAALVPGAPRALDPVIAEGLAKKPSDRFGTPRALVDALDAALLARSHGRTRARQDSESAARSGSQRQGRGATAASSAVERTPVSMVPGPRSSPRRSARIAVGILLSAVLGACALRSLSRPPPPAAKASLPASWQIVPPSPSESSPREGVDWSRWRDEIDQMQERVPLVKEAMHSKQRDDVENLAHGGAADLVAEDETSERMLRRLAEIAEQAVDAGLTGDMWIHLETVAGSVAEIAVAVGRARVRPGESKSRRFDVAATKPAYRLERTLSRIQSDHTGRFAAVMFRADAMRLIVEVGHELETLETCAQAIDELTARRSPDGANLRRLAQLGSLWRRLGTRTSDLVVREPNSRVRVAKLSLLIQSRQRDIAAAIAQNPISSKNLRLYRARITEGLVACGRLLQGGIPEPELRATRTAAAILVQRAPVFFKDESERDWVEPYARLREKLIAESKPAR